MGVHGEREIAMDQIDFAGADVIVHYLAIRGSEKSFAGGTLEVAKDFHDDRGVFGAAGHMRIDVCYRRLAGA
jgi:hypothetical protein